MININDKERIKESFFRSIKDYIVGLLKKAPFDKTIIDAIVTEIVSPTSIKVFFHGSYYTVNVKDSSIYNVDDKVNITIPQNNYSKMYIPNDGAIGGNVKLSSIPIGTIMLWAGDNIPLNCLICDGSEVSRTEYAALFEAIGTTYGVGNGSTTFNLPDLRGRVAVGLDLGHAEFNALGETGGEKTHKLTQSELPRFNNGLGGSAGDYAVTTGGSLNAIAIGTKAGSGATFMIEGGDQAHNNLQPYIVLTYIIKAFDDVVADAIIHEMTVDNDGTLFANSDLRIPTQKAVKTYADTKVSKGGDILSGPLGINGGVLGTNRFISFGSPDNKFRFTLGINNEVETGGNTGSAFFINRHDDNGEYIDSPLRIDRSTGVFNFAQTPTVANSLLWHGGNLHYETGTWTPTLYGSTVAGSPSYSSRSGRYTRLGNVVHLVGRVLLSSKGGMSGDVIIGGFPFQSNHQSAGVLGLTYNTAAVYDSVFALYMTSGATAATIYRFSQVTLKATEVGDNLVIASFEITYTTG